MKFPSLTSKFSLRFFLDFFFDFREILFLNGLRAVVAQHYSGEKMPEIHILIEYD
jgi:hypothetical protein